MKPDASLSLGSCRLEASTGEWYMDFENGVIALKQALVTAVDNECGVASQKVVTANDQVSEFDSDEGVV